MDSPLTQMQQRLEEHFHALAQVRDGSSFPIFALEHDLSEADLERIRSMVRLHPNTRPSSRQWLLWVVHATEVGYSYDGDEYWNSFEKQTPGWEHHYRPRIRAWFHKFRNAYGGVIPSGPWAKHFSIIAWPITHAILPRYLQRQFAKLLYDLRFRLASGSALEAQAIGRLLAVHASHTSKRFRLFLEQEELTGQIVLALLDREPDKNELIHSSTLKRIVADLERVRNTREWFKETQRVVSDRFKGIGRGPCPAASRPAEPPPERALPDTSHLVIRPSLLLRHVGAGTWSVFMEVKFFRPVAALNAEIHSFLNNTRCRLNGAHDFKPTGWLLSGDRKGALRSWPDLESPLIHFERPDSMVNHLIESECRLHSGPIWLFRKGADGIARHIAGRIVRPGLEYIVVTTMHIPNNLEGVAPCNLDCTDVNAYRLTMPSVVSTEMMTRLDSLGLQVARTIRVWPAGLPGRGWDGEGSSEWLTTESPCFGIAYDHPVESLAFRLNDAPEGSIRTGSKQPLFVRLPRLPAGEHTLTVKAHRSPELESAAPTPPAEGFVRLAVRDPEPWVPGIASHPGLIVRTDPDQADLDTFWRNNLGLSVNGPEGFTASIHVTLQSADGKEILSERVDDPMALPITQEEWHGRFERFLNSKGRAWRYLEATACTLAIHADTLGTCTLRFEHEPLPVRWVVHSDKKKIVVRLVDESGQDDADPEISSYNMEHPFESVSLTLDASRSGCVVEPPGRLFVVTHGRYRDAVFVSAGLTKPGLEGLGVESSFPLLPRSAHTLSTYIRLLGLWRDARLFGFLATVRHRRVMDSAVDALRAVLCGENWARKEKRFNEQPKSQTSIESLAASVDKRTDIGTILLRSRSEAGHTSDWFVDVAARRNVCPDRELSEFALRLAREPLEIADHRDLESLLAKLIDNPAILRAARLLTLLLSSASGNAPDANQTGRYST